MQEANPSPDYVSTDEMAGELRVNRMTIYRLIRRGEIPAIRVGRQFRVTRDDFDRYVEASKVTAAA